MLEALASAVAPPTQQGNQIVKRHSTGGVQIFSTTIARTKGREQLDEIREIHRPGTVEVFRTVGAAGGLAHGSVPAY